VRFQSGATGVVTHSWEFHANPPMPGYVLCGTKGTLKIHLDHSENELFTILGEPPEAFDTRPAPGAGDSMDRALAAFLDAIAGGPPPEITLAEGLRDVAIVEATYRSLESRQVEAVPKVLD